MKAVVLAAGLGTRLGALTKERAKATLPLHGRPLLAHVVAHLDRCGFDEIAVNLWYLPDQVRSALADARPRITWFPEPQLLGTAGALTQMREFLQEEAAFVVHYGDVLIDHDVGAMLRRHLRRRALLTMLVHERPGSNSVVEIAPDQRVRAFLERPSAEERAGFDSPWVNSGVYVMSPELLALVPAAPSDIARDLIPRALSAGPVFAEPVEGFRCAVDSGERLEEVERALSSGRWRSALTET